VQDGTGREYTPRWFVQQEGQWFWKAVHILSRSTKLFTPAILQRGLVMTEYSYSERSTVGWHVFGRREAVDASLIVRFSQRLSLGTRSRACHRNSTKIVLRCIPSSTSFFSFLLSSDLRTHQTAVINKMVPLKDVQGRVLQIQEQFRKLGFGHTYPSSPRQSARPHTPRPR